MSNNQIDKYLDGELEGKELEQFEEALKNDPKLAARVKLHRRLPEAIMEKDIVELEDSLKAIFEESKEQVIESPKPKIFPLRRILAIAASVVILVVAGWLIYQNNQIQTPEQLFADYMSPPSTIAPAQFRSSDPSDKNQIEQEIKKAWEQADQFYGQQNTAEALKKLQIIQELDPEFEVQSRSAYFYALGLVQLQNNTPQEALKAFDQIDSNDYKESVQWYRALTLLILPERSKEAIPMLEDISTSNHPKKEEASKLLKELKR